MKFSTSVDMALRILVFLAERKDTGLASAPEVSQVLQASYNNVVRIINRLQNAGLVITHAGRYGGMELALPQSQITVRAIVAAIDGPTKLSPCSHQASSAARIPSSYTEQHNCNMVHCGIREELLQLNEQINTLMESVSLATITQRHAARNSRKQTLQSKLSEIVKVVTKETVSETTPVDRPEELRKIGRRKRAAD